MTRQTVLLRRIIGHFATPTQLREFDELASKNKGSATHAGLRLIENYFEKRDRRENPERYREERTIKINSANGSSVMNL